MYGHIKLQLVVDCERPVTRHWTRRTHHLEQPAGQRDICPFSVNLPSAFKNISVPGLVR